MFAVVSIGQETRYIPSNVTGRSYTQAPGSAGSLNALVVSDSIAQAPAPLGTGCAAPVGRFTV